MAGTYEIPAVGSPNSTEQPKVKTFIEGWNAKLNTENDLEDSGIASPNNSAYRTLFSGVGFISKENAAGTYWCSFGSSQTATASPSNPMTAVVVGSGGGVSEALPPLLNLTAADLAVNNKTTKMQLRVAVLTNEVKPLLSFTPGLYPVTSKGGENGVVLTLGTVVTGSTIAVSEPSANSVTRAVTAADFSLPADGLYALGFVTSAKLTAKAGVIIFAQLQTRSV